MKQFDRISFKQIGGGQLIACIKQFISISRFLSNRSLKPKHPCCLNTSICNNKMAKGVDYFLVIKMFLRCDPHDHAHDPDYFDHCCIFRSFCLGQIHFPSTKSYSPALVKVAGCC